MSYCKLMKTVMLSFFAGQGFHIPLDSRVSGGW